MINYLEPVRLFGKLLGRNHNPEPVHPFPSHSGDFARRENIGLASDHALLKE